MNQSLNPIYNNTQTIEFLFLNITNSGSNVTALTRVYTRQQSTRIGYPFFPKTMGERTHYSPVNV
jgi:hypothetical protein